MKKTITYNDLWLLENDIQSTKESLPALWLIHENLFLKLISNNAMHFKVLHNRMKEIQKKYIVHDEEDNPVRDIPNEGNEQKWKYLESIVGKNGQLLTGEEVEKAYLEESGEFLKRHITLEF